MDNMAIGAGDVKEESNNIAGRNVRKPMNDTDVKKESINVLMSNKPSEPKQEAKLVEVGLGIRLNLETGKFNYNMPPEPGLALLLLRKLNKEVERLIDNSLEVYNEPKKSFIQKINPYQSMKRFVGIKNK